MSTHFDSPLYRDFPSTSKLTREELEELLGQQGASNKPLSQQSTNDNDNDAYFEAFVDSLPEVRAMLDEHSKLLKENESKAARNLSLQPQLEATRAETQQYHDRALAAEAEWPKAEAQMKEAYRRFAPPSLHAQIVQAATKLHEQSEMLASAFVDGLPLETGGSEAASQTTAGDSDALFTRRYREMRTEYHRLNLIAERWANGTVQWE
ncbi:unnamed protein product [Sympodiomycopsis kandeliae]